MAAGRQGQGRRVLGQVNFRRFFLGEIINNAGSSMSAIALAFAVLDIDNSPIALGLVAASATVPMVAFMLLGGALADRLPRALLLRGCNLVQGVAQAVAAVLVITGVAQVWELAVLEFVAGTVSAASYPAFMGMVPILLPEPDRKAGYLLIGQSRSLLRIAGPALAGVLVAVANPGWVLAFDALTFVGAAWFLAQLVLPRGARPNQRSSVLGDFAAGWSYSAALGWVIPGACTALIYNALTSGGIGVLGPTIAHATIGSEGWGFARSGQAVGLFAFTFVLTRTVIRRPMVVIQFGFLTSAVPMLVLALWVHTIPLALAFVVAGCGSATLDLAWNLLVQEKVTEDMLSRVMAIDGFFSFVAVPLGELLVGPFAHAFDARDVELGCVALSVVTCLVGSLTPRLRNLRLDPPELQPVTAPAG